MTFADDQASTAALKARVKKLEEAMGRLQSDVQSQTQDLVRTAIGFARTDARVFIQNTTSAAVHYAKTNAN